MKVLFVAVFKPESTNWAQAAGFRNCGVELIEYNYRHMAGVLGGEEQRDQDLIDLCKAEMPDLVVFAKCNNMSVNVINECNLYSTTCLWFMDAYLPQHWTSELVQKIKKCNIVCCDKFQAVEEASKLNSNTYHVCEGFDSSIDRPRDVDKDMNVSFIGNPYGNRGGLTDAARASVITGAYGKEHAKMVGRSLINLNFCTGECASDRVYKIMAAKGFLLTDDWYGRDKMFEDGEDLVIFKDKEDLLFKIKYYLDNEELLNKIANCGYNTVQKYSRDKWAEEIINAYKKYNT